MAKPLPDPKPKSKLPPLWLLPVFLVAAALGAALAFHLKPSGPDLYAGAAPRPAPPGMVWIPGGTFRMGSVDSTPRFRDAKPIHAVSVTGFFMDVHEVTNDEFAKFVAATGYKTIAERTPDKAEIMSKAEAGAHEPKESDLVPGSLVFTPPPGPVPWDNEARWWMWTPGANWMHPEGPGSDLKNRGNHPVVHVAYDDALAYCKWAGKRLPTEAEWEYAARGGLDQQPYTWGTEAPDAGGTLRCNIWLGDFPHNSTKPTGQQRTTPVGSYAPNGFGLHDMAGNVWEWCNDWYMPDYYAKSPDLNPAGPATSADPERGFNPMRVHRGGSFLCSEGFCERYKPGGRGRTDPLTGMSHLGFRCVQDAK